MVPSLTLLLASRLPLVRLISSALPPSALASRLAWALGDCWILGVRFPDLSK